MQTIGKRILNWTISKASPWWTFKNAHAEKQPLYRLSSSHTPASSPFSAHCSFPLSHFLGNFSPSLLHRYGRHHLLSGDGSSALLCSRGMASYSPPKPPSRRAPPSPSQSDRFRTSPSDNYRSSDAHHSPDAHPSSSSSSFSSYFSKLRSASKQRSPSSSSSSSSSHPPLDHHYSSIYHYHPFIAINCYEPYDRAILPLNGENAEGNPWIPLLLLTALNGWVWLQWLIAADETNPDSERDQQQMYRHWTVSVENVREGRLHTLLTSAFSHQTGPHIMGNLFALWLFGFTPARMMNVFFKTGRPGFLTLYVVGGVMASLGHLVYLVLSGQTQVLSPAEKAAMEKEFKEHSKLVSPEMKKLLITCDKPALGASGAVMATSASCACLVPWDRVRPRMFQLFSLTIPVAVSMYVISDLISLTTGISGGVGNAAHLSGFLVGLIYTSALWRRSSFTQGRNLPLLDYFRRNRPPIRYKPAASTATSA